jgi:hypothetical protein
LEQVSPIQYHTKKLNKMKNEQLRKHLSEFGNYLLSEERKASYYQMAEERLSRVSHADIENYFSSIPAIESSSTTLNEYGHTDAGKFSCFQMNGNIGWEKEGSSTKSNVEDCKTPVPQNEVYEKKKSFKERIEDLSKQGSSTKEVDINQVKNYLMKSNGDLHYQCPNCGNDFPQRFASYCFNCGVKFNWK